MKIGFGQSLISFAYFDDKMTWKPSNIQVLI